MFFYVLIVEILTYRPFPSFTIRIKSENSVLADGFNKCGFTGIFCLPDHLETDSGEHLIFFSFWRVIWSNPGFL